MRRVILTVVAALAAAGAAADEREFDPIYDYRPQPEIDYPGSMTGKTLSAVAFLPVAEPRAAAAGGGASSLRRVVFEVYLAPGGEATAHAWDTRSARYTPLARTRWSLAERTLCLDLAAFAPGQRRCFEVHIWGPNIAGTGRAEGGILKGDLRPGNQLGGG